MLHVFPSGMPRAIVSLCALEATAASSISSFCLPLVHCSSSPAANHHTFPISQLSFFLQTHHLHSLTCVCPMHNPPGRPADRRSPPKNGGQALPQDLRITQHICFVQVLYFQSLDIIPYGCKFLHPSSPGDKQHCSRRVF